MLVWCYHYAYIVIAGNAQGAATMKQFVAVVKHEGQSYYALFSFDLTEVGVIANAKYVKSWPQHEALTSDAGADILNATYDDFVDHMEAHILRELQC